MSNDQDWETVVFRKKAPPKKKKLTTDELNAARIAGQVETVKKFSAGTNKQRPAQAARRLDDDDFDAPITIRTEVRKRISQARQAKGWTQKELAGKINEKPTVVSAYESDTKCVPNSAILMKLEKVLDVKLRGDLS